MYLLTINPERIPIPFSPNMSETKAALINLQENGSVIKAVSLILNTKVLIIFGSLHTYVFFVSRLFLARVVLW